MVLLAFAVLEQLRGRKISHNRTWAIQICSAFTKPQNGWLKPIWLEIYIECATIISLPMSVALKVVSMIEKRKKKLFACLSGNLKRMGLIQALMSQKTKQDYK